MKIQFGIVLFQKHIFRRTWQFKVNNFKLKLKNKINVMEN